MAGLLIMLALFGGVGAAVVNAVRSPPASSVAKKNYARLPEMSFAIGGDRQTMDLKALIELEPGVDPTVAAPYMDRIADRLSDRMRQIEPDRLAGADGAKLVKSTIASVLEREMKTVKVKDILLDRFVIH